MAKYLQDCEEEGIFDGPLTDYEVSEDEEGQGGSNASMPVSEGNVVALGIRKLYKKGSQRRHRNLKRAGVLKNEGAGVENAGDDVKQHAAKHRARTARDAGLLVDFSMASDADVTVPGWVGKTPKTLPCKPLSLHELRAMYDLTLFPWEGRCVVAVPSPFFLPHPLAGPATFFWTRKGGLLASWWGSRRTKAGGLLANVPMKPFSRLPASSNLARQAPVVSGAAYPLPYLMESPWAQAIRCTSTPALLPQR